jgi:acetyl esterase/lipase
VPVHHEFAERFPLLEGVETFEAFMSDPQYADRFAQFVHWDGAEPPTVETFDTRAPGLRGDVPLRVYRASSPEPRPVLVWIHGGGFFTGGLDMAEADWTAREIAARADAVVVSVDYRLAVGGVCYPVPLDDCVAATRWVRAPSASRWEPMRTASSSEAEAREPTCPSAPFCASGTRKAGNRKECCPPMVSSTLGCPPCPAGSSTS